MNLWALLARFRQDLSDTQEPHLWTDEQIIGDCSGEQGSSIGFINEAYLEAAERGRLIDDTETPAVCEVAVSANTARYALHPSIIEITYAALDSRPDNPLSRTTTEDLDASIAGWRTRQGGRVTDFVSPDNGGQIILYPIPSANDTLRLEVKRRPLKLLLDCDDVPEIAERHHARMLYWAYHLAYSVTETDVQNEGLAAKYRALFEESFGYRHSAKAQKRQSKHRPPIVSYGGY